MRMQVVLQAGAGHVCCCEAAVRVCSHCLTDHKALAVLCWWAPGGHLGMAGLELTQYLGAGACCRLVV